MKLFINQEECIECGTCEETCPDIFKLPDGEKAQVVEKYRINNRAAQGDVPMDLVGCAQSAITACPVSVICQE